MSTEVIDVSIERIRSIRELELCWIDLESRADAEFFVSWHWIGTWLAGLEALPFILMAKVGEKVIGLAVISLPVTSKSRIFNVSSIYLNQTGNIELDAIATEYNDVLVDREYEERVKTECIRHLIETKRLNGKMWQQFVVSGVVDTPPYIALTAKNRGTIRDIAITRTVDVDLENIKMSGKTYLEHLSSNTRSQIRRSMKAYKARGELTLTYASSTEEALEYFEQLGGYNKSKWIKKSNHSNFDIPFFVGFHRRLIAENYDKGVIELAKVCAGDRVISYLYNYVYRKKVYFYSSGLVFESENKLKPGLTSHYLCIESHIDRGNRVYDFMAGESRYKSSLGKDRHLMKSIAIQKRHLYFTIEKYAISLRNAFRR